MKRFIPFASLNLGRLKNESSYTNGLTLEAMFFKRIHFGKVSSIIGKRFRFVTFSTYLVPFGARKRFKEDTLKPSESQSFSAQFVFHVRKDVTPCSMSFTIFRTLVFNTHIRLAPHRKRSIHVFFQLKKSLVIHLYNLSKKSLVGKKSLYLYLVFFMLNVFAKLVQTFPNKSHF